MVTHFEKLEGTVMMFSSDDRSKVCVNFGTKFRSSSMVDIVNLEKIE